MDTENNQENNPTDKPNIEDEFSNAGLKFNVNEEKPAKKIKRQATQEELYACCKRHLLGIGKCLACKADCVVDKNKRKSCSANCGIVSKEEDILAKLSL